MRLTISPWVHHSGGAIYSLDLSPTADKLATCGQGEIGGDGLVVIWNLLPLTIEKCGKDLEKNKPVLARIQHQAGVNCVRWSRCGKMLGCAGDDRTVTVWEYGGRVKSAGTIGKASGDTNVEKYKCAHTMHGHSMEVLAVEWSHDGYLLASASMDNSIVVWNARKLPERIVVLDSMRGGHTSSVKGLSFDPIGKYLATQSSDKTLKLWTMDTWTVDTTVSKPFEESAQSTMFLRLDWTPDGQFLVAPGAMNNGGPTAQIIKRKGWETSLDLVGHRKAVTVIRICPRLIRYTDNTGKEVKVGCLAVGSRDKSVSIWVIPQVKRPLVVVTNVFKHSVMDATWRDFNLICCSQDGSVKTFSFSEKELGRMLSQEEMGDICEDLYRTRPVQLRSEEGDVNGSPTKALNGSFIDTPEELVAARRAEKSGLEKKETKEKEQLEADRRAKEEKELVEKRKEQTEDRTKDGKRRIQPIFLCSTIDTSVPPEVTKTDTVMEKEKEEEKKDNTPRITTITTKSIPKRGEEDNKKRRKRRRTETTTDTGTSEMDSGDEDGGKRRESTQRELLVMADFRKPFLRPIESLPIRFNPSEAFLDAPEETSTLNETVNGMTGMSISVQNEWSTGGVKTSRICLIKTGDTLTNQSIGPSTSSSSSSSPSWTSFLPHSVLFISANVKWVVAACTDCTMRILNTSTGTISLALQLDSLPARIGLSGDHSFVLTTNAFFSAWDLSKMTSICTRIPIVDCVVRDTCLNGVSLTPSGAPLLSFSNGNSFSYSTRLQCWHLVDSSSPLSRLCQGLAYDEMGEGVIGKMLKRKKKPATVPSISMNTRASVCEGQLEGWLAASLQLNSHNDTKATVLAYTRQLLKHRSTGKLRQLVSWMEEKMKEEKGKEGRMKSLLQEVTTLINGDTSLGGLMNEMHENGTILF